MIVFSYLTAALCPLDFNQQFLSGQWTDIEQVKSQVAIMVIFSLILDFVWISFLSVNDTTSSMDF